MSSRRYQPNILVTGTPGCGKSTTCELLHRRLPNYEYYNISDFAKEHNCHDGYDEGRKSHIVDEDKLLDELEPLLCKGASIIDWHVNDVFPERLIDLVVVLRCNNSILYERLKGRGYHDSKIEENIDAEIMGVLLQDAMDSYKEEIVVELESDSTEQMESNVERVVSWVELWKDRHAEGVTNELHTQEDGENEKEGRHGEDDEDDEDNEEDDGSDDDDGDSNDEDYQDEHHEED